MCISKLRKNLRTGKKMKRKVQASKHKQSQSQRTNGTNESNRENNRHSDMDEGKNDKERFSKYLEDVKSGKSTIAFCALLPHEIMAMLNDSDGGEVAEIQWKRMVDDLLKKGSSGTIGS
ncbi:hypothetical protein CCACVL1_03264 [Corchorus capsularis]|uniref:DUF2828 domain-containing protein n=1 Tax=Corchorus capsularis TaxID=210143 RepID=A0A1R3K1B3_COCAP|nr:hypothetical protein CCACVL1_03264 [Corchorus capsularis]